ncbi:MAG: alpha/beta hydrolase [Lentimicrobium sp.]|nr:alpha/beta hydrolase [Lentimicrobium sp.]
MRRKVFSVLFSTITICTLFIVCIVFLPRNYDVPQMQNRKSTRFWDLSTGSEIAYTLISGKEPKKNHPIIYLHGGPGGPIDNSNINTLSLLSDDGYDIYLYDQIGGGHSGRLDNIDDYTADRHKSDLEEIVKIIGAEKIILIGQSWGAMLANMFIVEHPEKVERMIFTGPGPILPINTELANITPPDSLNLKEPYYTNRQGNEKARNVRSMLTQKCAMMFGYKLASDKEADKFATYLNTELNKSTLSDTSITRKVEGGAGYYAHIMTTKSFKDVKDQRYRIKNLNIPVLIMKGQYDNQKWGYTQEYLALYSNSKLVVIPNAGHAIAVEKPEQYIKTIRAFINPQNQRTTREKNNVDLKE